MLYGLCTSIDPGPFLQLRRLSQAASLRTTDFFTVMWRLSPAASLPTTVFFYGHVVLFPDLTGADVYRVLPQVPANYLLFDC